ncbi:thiamine phosphate synthase [Myroides sp. NP-2]|uniref:thiamine phosphate synthase n=1 Tax=Myroides sp. NP-2 TaxID=2759945 RepID=UPI0015F88A4D|nr:thiamine phosphate synthase [Myroides sp. NP-2]MBB1150601.1 thiamine phosphate synthase [Myroides sp. NP-2]
MVVITPPDIHPKEISLANEMLARGLPLLHLRKPKWTFENVQKWVEKISYQHRQRLVIHIPTLVMNNKVEVFKQYTQLINTIKADYTHLSTINCSFVNKLGNQLPYLSTSVHNSSEYQKLSTQHRRVFLSPVFSSISKKSYHPTVNWQQEIQQWSFPWIHTVALGGVTPTRLSAVRAMGFNDFAILGSIWQADDPLKQFDLCYRQDQLLFR